MQPFEPIPQGYTLLKWKLTDAMINERVKCLMPEVPKDKATDCAINTLYFLGQLDDPEVARFIASQKNKPGSLGTYPAETLGYLYHAYSVNEFKRDDKKLHFSIDHNDSEYAKQLKNMIGDGYCTLINVYWSKRKTGHTLIAGVYKNQLLAIDAQQETVMLFTKMVETQHNDDEGHINEIGLIYRKYDKKRTLVKSMIRRRSSSNKTTKRRRIGSRTRRSRSRSRTRRSRSRSRTRRSRSRSRTRRSRSRSRSKHSLRGSRYGSRREPSRSRSRDRVVHTSDIMTE